MKYTRKLSNELNTYARICRGTPGMEGDAERALAASAALEAGNGPRATRKAAPRRRKARKSGR